MEGKEDVLKQHILVNHLAHATGCNQEQAAVLLTQSRWNLEMALSLYFQEAGVGHAQGRASANPLCAPSNTPATPPSFESALAALSRMGCGTPQDARGVLHSTNMVPRPLDACMDYAENALHHTSQPQQIVNARP